MSMSNCLAVFCPPGVVHPIPCPVGGYCATSTVFTICPKGYKCPPESSAPTLCESGMNGIPYISYPPYISLYPLIHPSICLYILIYPCMSLYSYTNWLSLRSSPLLVDHPLHLYPYPYNLIVTFIVHFHHCTRPPIPLTHPLYPLSSHLASPSPSFPSPSFPLSFLLMTGDYCGEQGTGGDAACPASRYCPTPMEFIVCPALHYCPKGSVAPLACDDATSELAYYCPEGMYSYSLVIERLFTSSIKAIS